MIRINLLPVREARRQASLRQQGVLLGASAALAALTCIGLHVAVVAEIAGEKARITEANAELQRLEATLKEVEKFRKEKEAIEAKLAVIAKLERDRRGPVQMMDELSSRIPERLWLRELRLHNGVLELKGSSTDNEVIASFMTSLSESPVLARVELQESALKEENNLKINEFRITCRDRASLEAQADAGGAPKGKRAGARSAAKRR